MADEKENRLDNIFITMGELKTFTVRQALLLMLIGLPISYQQLSYVFICQDVPHHCATPAHNDTSGLLVGLEGYKDNLTIFYDQCQIVVSHNNNVLKTESCIYGMQYDQPKDASVVSQFDLVCDYKSLAKFSQTLVIAGEGIGATFFTMVSDRFGRKPVLVISNFGLMVCGLIIAYAPNYTVFALFKFVVGAFIQGDMLTFITLLLEMSTTKTRRINAICAGPALLMGSMSLALWAFIFREHSWRTLQMVVSLSSLSFLLHLWYGKESLRWLIANGKSKAITAYIQTATTLNKTSFNDTMKALEDACHQSNVNSNQETRFKTTAARKLTLLDLFKVKRLLLNAVILWIAWFTTVLSYYVLYLTSTSLAGDPYLNFFLTAFMGLPNCLLLFFLLNRLARKVTLVLFFVIVSIGMTLSGVFRSLEETNVNSAFALLFSLVTMVGVTACFSLISLYTPEIFPTNMRNQAVGVSSLIGRIGGMIAPFTSVLSEKAKWGPGVMIGGCAFVVCLLTVFLPETRRRELPQTIEDVQAWYSKKKDKETTIENDENKASLII